MAPTYRHVPRVKLLHVDREVVEGREVEEHQARVWESNPLARESFGTNEADFGQFILAHGNGRVAARAGYGRGRPCFSPDAHKHRYGRPEVDLRPSLDFFSSFKKHDGIFAF